MVKLFKPILKDFPNFFYIKFPPDSGRCHFVLVGTNLAGLPLLNDEFNANMKDFKSSYYRPVPDALANPEPGSDIEAVYEAWKRKNKNKVVSWHLVGNRHPGMPITKSMVYVTGAKCIKKSQYKKLKKGSIDHLKAPQKMWTKVVDARYQRVSGYAEVSSKTLDLEFVLSQEEGLPVKVINHPTEKGEEPSAFYLDVCE